MTLCDDAGKIQFINFMADIKERETLIFDIMTIVLNESWNTLENEFPVIKLIQWINLMVDIITKVYVPHSYTHYIDLHMIYSQLFKYDICMLQIMHRLLAGGATQELYADLRRIRESKNPKLIDAWINEHINYGG